MSSVSKREVVSISMRPMILADLPVILTLEREIFTDDWPLSTFEEVLTTDGWQAMVAESESKIIGYSCFLRVEDELHLANIAVEASWRRKSVAKQLLGRILDEAEAGDCAMILLEVRVSNIGAIRFYEAHDFSEWSRRPRYYHSPDEDALVMVRYLKESTTDK